MPTLTSGLNGRVMGTSREKSAGSSRGENLYQWHESQDIKLDLDECQSQKRQYENLTRFFSRLDPSASYRAEREMVWHLDYFKNYAHCQKIEDERL
jgi:hypothetical protein